jgi:hypothetical protein
VTTLLETLTALEAALDVLDDATAHETASATIGHVTAGVSKRHADLKKIGGRYTDPSLPGPAGANISRWPTVLAALDRLVDRVRTAPETIRDDRLWTDTDATVKALVRDVTEDVRERWHRVRPSEADSDASFLAGLPPGTKGVERYRELAGRLRDYTARDLPERGDAHRLQAVHDELKALRNQLQEHEPPASLRADLQLLERGALPLDRYEGELKEYLDRTGLAQRLRLGLVAG